MCGIARLKLHVEPIFERPIRFSNSKLTIPLSGSTFEVVKVQTILRFFAPLNRMGEAAVDVVVILFALPIYCDSYFKVARSPAIYIKLKSNN